jgi:hypothetical protein
MYCSIFDFFGAGLVSALVPFTNPVRSVLEIFLSFMLFPKTLAGLVK